MCSLRQVMKKNEYELNNMYVNIYIYSRIYSHREEYSHEADYSQRKRIHIDVSVTRANHVDDLITMER